MEQPRKDEQSAPNSVNEDEMGSPRDAGAVEMKDLSSKQKMLDMSPSLLPEPNAPTDALDHSFDEDDVFYVSPDRKGELPDH
jgi:hypothetical protein